MYRHSIAVLLYANPSTAKPAAAVPRQATGIASHTINRQYDNCKFVNTKLAHETSTRRIASVSSVLQTALPSSILALAKTNHAAGSSIISSEFTNG